MVLTFVLCSVWFMMVTRGDMLPIRVALLTVSMMVASKTVSKLSESAA